MPLVGGDAHQCGIGERTDPGGAGDGDGGRTPPAAGRRMGTDDPVKARSGGPGVARAGGEALCEIQSGALVEGVHRKGDVFRIKAPINGRPDGADTAAVDCDQSNAEWKGSLARKW